MVDPDLLLLLWNLLGFCLDLLVLLAVSQELLAGLQPGGREEGRKEGR